MVTAMNKEFYAAYRSSLRYDLEWLAFLGCPMIYDGGLCVNRTLEEVEHSSKFKYHFSLEF